MNQIGVGNIETLGLAADVAIWISVVVFVLVCSIMVYVLVLRAILIIGSYYRARFTKLWSKRLTDSLEKPASSLSKLPPLSFRRAMDFLIVWNTFHDMYKHSPERTTRLNVIAVQLGVNEWAYELLRRRGLRRSLLGIMTLGHLRDESKWQRISEYAVSKNPTLSLVAMKALFLINGNAAINIFIYLVGSRDDWSRTMCASILDDAGPGIVSLPIAAAVLNETDLRAERILPFLACCDPEVARTAARKRLAMTRNNDKITGLCLKMISRFGTSEDLELVRQYSEHSRWHVRAQAARALGRIGTREDLVQLINLLNDAQWWVRYRAAQALASLPFIQIEALERFRDDQTDNYGRDMLAHVIAERTLAKSHDPTSYF